MVTMDGGLVELSTSLLINPQLIVELELPSYSIAPGGIAPGLLLPG